MSKHPTVVLLVLLSSFLLPSRATAQFTDFEDLTLGTTYPATTTFSSKGLTFDVDLFGGFGSPVNVSDAGNANGSGLELFLPNTIGLDFQLPPDTQEISLLYGGVLLRLGRHYQRQRIPLGHRLDRSGWHFTRGRFDNRNADGHRPGRGHFLGSNFLFRHRRVRNSRLTMSVSFRSHQQPYCWYWEWLDLHVVSDDDEFKQRAWDTK